MSDITLTNSARNSLLSLTNTASLMSRTQGRLTSGLKVASAIDDAISYFQAKGLDDRSADFANRKDQIDQGISNLKAGLNGTTMDDSVLKQMRGLLDSARTADQSTRKQLGATFSSLAYQINSGLSDASYQGLNLVNNSMGKLSVYFNQGTGAVLNVNATNLKMSVAVTVTALAASAGGKNGSAASKYAGVLFSKAGASAGVKGFSNISAMKSPAAVLNKMQSYLDSTIQKVRSVSASLGANVTFLQTRMDFTANYINTMTEGSGKLTLADLNNEGANLVALQTRQQIGVQSLSIAGQQQQSILSLLR